MSVEKMWNLEKRSEVKAKIDQAAKSVAEMIGAKGCVIIAFFPEGEFMHTQDGGFSPMPFKELYAQLLTAWTVMEESGGKDVAIS